MSLPLRYPLDSVSFERALEDLIVRFIINVPPEDLATVERELFHFEEAQWFYTDFIKLTNPHLPNLRIKTFASYVISMCPLIWKWQDVNPDEALQKFSKYKKSIPVRGAAIFNENLNKILLVKGTESDSWSFPRGKISKDEDDVDCCIREVMEEIGFDLTSYIDEDQYVERNIGGKNYKIYLVKGVPQDFPFKPQVRNEIEKIEWQDFWKLSRSIHKSTSSRYYLMSSMLKPLSLWVKKQKQIQNEEQLKQYAEEQLKLLLGIGTSQDNSDPGRDLLNMLQSSVWQKKPIKLPDEESQTSMSTTSAPATVVAPSTANSQNILQPAATAFYGGYAFQFPQNPLPGMQTLNPFPFANTFPQSISSPASYSIVPQQQQQQQQQQHALHHANSPQQQPKQQQELHPNLQLQNSLPVLQSPQTPVVKPTVLEETSNNSKQLLELLKNQKKPDLEPELEPEEESSAKTLLKILKNSPKELSNRAHKTSSFTKNGPATRIERSVSEQSSDSTNAAGYRVTKQKSISLYSPRSSFSDATSPDEVADQYENFESSSEEEDLQEDGEDDEDDEDDEDREDKVVYFNKKQQDSTTVMEINSSKSELYPLDGFSHADNSENLSTRSLQSDAPDRSKIKPKFKLLKRGEKLANNNCDNNTKPVETNFIQFKDQKEPESESQQSNASSNEFLSILRKSRIQNQSHLSASESTHGLMPKTYNSNSAQFNNPLFGANQLKSEEDISNDRSSFSKEKNTNELLSLLKRPQFHLSEPQVPVISPSTNASSENPSFYAHLPYVVQSSKCEQFSSPQPPSQTYSPSCSAVSQKNSKDLLTLLQKPKSESQTQSSQSMSVTPSPTLSPAQELLGLLKK
ncbi:decapping enzyme complex catalytic subunit Ecym_8207 [Eremothecium cymbalariae DBVPG|uniref:Nudix hydrolase domain-containing protein n=1 Tax=Eremothecium cymbalariae (strain CBS 270.75 / DBVPG 7215 / KCTC 17166 / NRRL Y-17582) TaxID=931890 RepID=G8JXB8_ERECY|nr:Hypothetical protein Ecym_8207 [Eremothecium cymbalariae DBVPG\